MNRLTISLAAGLMVCACSHHEVAVPPAPVLSPPSVEQKPSIDLSTVEIKLERTECYGWCPSYEVTVKGSGEVQYTGHSFVKDVGEHTKNLSKEAVQALLKQFNDADFLNLKDVYEQTVTDIPSTFLYLRVGDKANRIEIHWLGERQDGFGEEVPGWQILERLDALAGAIDGAINIDQWIGTEDERRALFQRAR